MEEWWNRPDHFDPERFTSPRDEHKRHSFSWYPFGGGAHKCIGMHFAEMLFKTVLFHIVKSHQFTLPLGYPLPHENKHFQWVPMPRPKDGLPLFIKKLTRH